MRPTPTSSRLAPSLSLSWWRSPLSFLGYTSSRTIVERERLLTRDGRRSQSTPAASTRSSSSRAKPSMSDDETDFRQAGGKPRDASGFSAITQPVNPDSSLPTCQILTLMLALLPEAVSESVLFPLIYFMVRDYNVADSPDKIGYYAGILGSAFYVSTFATHLFWGWLSDMPSMGRKRVAMCGLLGTALGMIMLGFAKSFAFAIFCRVFSGCFNSNSTVGKAMLGEMTAAGTPTDRARAYAAYGSLYGAAYIIGPLIGGALEGGAGLGDFFPILSAYRYLLPCLTVSALSVTCFFIVGRRLKDPRATAELRRSPQGPTPFARDLETINSDSIGENSANAFSFDIEDAHSVTTLHSHQEQDPIPEVVTVTRSSSNRLVAVAISCYAIMSLCSSYYHSVFPLWAATRWTSGGLSFSTKKIAMSVTTFGLFKMTLQMLIFPQIHARLGSIWSYRLGMSFFIPIVISMPFLHGLISPIPANTTASVNHGSFLSNLSSQFINDNVYDQSVWYQWPLWIMIVLFMIGLALAESLCFLSVIIKITDFSQQQQPPAVLAAPKITSLNAASSSSDPAPLDILTSTTTLMVKRPFLIPAKVTKSLLGTVHGIASSFAALMRIVGPFFSGSVWSWSLRHGTPKIAFFVVAGVGAMGILATVVEAYMLQLHQRNERQSIIVKRPGNVFH